MSENTDRMQKVFKLSSEANRLLKLYENPIVTIAPDYTVELTASQIQSLKQTFAAKRAEAIQTFNDVTAQ